LYTSSWTDLVEEIGCTVLSLAEALKSAMDIVGMAVGALVGVEVGERAPTVNFLKAHWLQHGGVIHPPSRSKGG
jgi:hypothetical protein